MRIDVFSDGALERLIRMNRVAEIFVRQPLGPRAHAHMRVLLKGRHGIQARILLPQAQLWLARRYHRLRSARLVPRLPRRMVLPGRIEKPSMPSFRSATMPAES